MEIIKEYNLLGKVDHEGYIYIEVCKGMYGLPQAGILVQELLAERLDRHGYQQSAIIPEYWKHDTMPIDFTLVVGDFGIKYTKEEHKNHLLGIM